MLSPERLGYLFLNVRDVEASTEFYEKAVHLEVTERKDGRVYLRGGTDHHWLVLKQSDSPGLERIGIEVEDSATLDAYQELLHDKGIHVEAGDGLESDRILRYLRFYDPSGNPLELYCDMVTVNPTKAKPIHFEEIQHIVIAVHDFPTAIDFYTNVIGMKVSDFSERSNAWMHFRNGWHHGIGIASGGGRTSGLNHVCFMPEDLDMTMRARAAVQRLGLKITNDILKHRGSESIGFYFQGPDTTVEFSWGARKFAVDEVYKPRVLARNMGGDIWKAGLEDLELLSAPIKAEVAT